MKLKETIKEVLLVVLLLTTLWSVYQMNEIKNQLDLVYLLYENSLEVLLENK